MTYSITITKEAQVKKATALLTKGKWLTETDMHLVGNTFKTTSKEGQRNACFYLKAMGIKLS